MRIKSEEDIDNYVHQLRKAAERCKYDEVDHILRDHIFIHDTSKTVQNVIIKLNNPSLTVTVETIKQHNLINIITCKGCQGNCRLRSLCPAQGHTGSKCNKFHHLEPACEYKKRLNGQMQINTVSNHSTSQVNLKFSINNCIIPIKFLIDSGSPVNLINSIVLKLYNNTKIFYLTDYMNIIGYELSNELGLLHFNKSQCQNLEDNLIYINAIKSKTVPLFIKPDIANKTVNILNHLFQGCVDKFNGIFSIIPGRTSLYHHKIDTTNDTGFKSPIYFIP
ncbi:hypothetical protein A3Q56_05789, partial [Intoshia linei]